MTARETIMDSARHGSSSKLAATLLALLLATDIALIYSHVIWGYDYWVWNLEFESGYAESFQHLKWSVAAAGMLFLAFKRRATIYAVWSVLFLYLLIDDSQAVHERVGKWLVSPLDLQAFQEVYHRHFEYFLLQAQDFGQLIVALSLGIAIVIMLYPFWPDQEATRERTVTKWLIAWVLLFAFFAVGMDMLHVMAWEIYPPAIDVLTVVEDGGEMICASILVAATASSCAGLS